MKSAAALSIVFALAAVLLSFQHCVVVVAQSGKNLTSLLDWKPPSDFHAKFPYYISGFDKAGRPIILWDVGKWNIRAVASQGADAAEMAGKYIEQLAQVGVQVAEAFKEEGGMAMIADFDGFSIGQITSIPSAGVFLRFVPYATAWETALDLAIGINLNFAAERLFAFLQPFLGKLFAKSELFGTNKDRWLPKVLNEISRSQLPPWLGGKEDWKPIQILGKGEPVDLALLRKKGDEFQMSQMKQISIT